MKKVLLIAAVAGLSLVSCKKDYTCDCTTTSTVYMNGTATTGTPTNTSTDLGKMKKDDAVAKCNEGDAEATSGDTNFGGKTVQTCELK